MAYNGVADPEGPDALHGLGVKVEPASDPSDTYAENGLRTEHDGEEEEDEGNFSNRPPTVIYLGNHNVLEEYEQQQQQQSGFAYDDHELDAHAPETPRKEQPAAVADERRDGSDDDEDEEEPSSPQSVIAARRENGADTWHAADEDEVADDNGPPSQRSSPDGSTRAASEEHDAPPETMSTAETQQAETASRPSTSDAPKASALGSMVFVRTALENIAASKEARRKKPLYDSAQAALAAIKADKPIEPEAIFLPLSLATETTSIPLTTTSLDCIGKLITYSYFSMSAPKPDASGKPQAPLIERAIDTICDCFQDEATPAEVQLQIVKSLLAAVLNDKIIVHGAGLLKAVRQVYNIFLLSKAGPNQQIAQGTLTQMVGTVFERVKSRLAIKEARVNSGHQSPGKGPAAASQPDLNDYQSQADDNATLDGEDGDIDGSSDAASSAPTNGKESTEKMTLQSFENAKNFDDTRIGDNAPTMVTRAKGEHTFRSVSSQHTSEDRDPLDEENEDEIYVKDAFLVFRSMCRLSTKVLAQEQLQDLKSQNMRSKLISLAIIRTIMNNNMDVFTSPLVTIRGSANNEPTSFGQAINQYLRLALSRNGASSVKQVFETSCEIFWLMLKDMRVMLKRELEVFLKEIYLSILERRNAPGFQKLYIMRLLRRLASEPKVLVEIYLNYDCDRSALDNLFQRTIELLSKITSTPINISPQQQQQYQEQHPKESNFDVDWRDQGKMPPSLTTAALSSHPQSDTELPIEFLLKQQSLECLVRTLKSLVDWAQISIRESPDRSQPENGSKTSLDELRVSQDPQHPGTSPRPSAADTPTVPGTPMLDDDPGQFEIAKQRKTALSNGIRQFNFKPKRGIKQLIKDGFIEDDKPESIAVFIIQNDRLDKAQIGEYLGEGEPENIAIMHAFVDSMEFTKRRFVDALRYFLQSFRLPGEAQKIDRFMLKFAERYITGNPNAFANADTAYVLAYSVILLNTDQHSAKMKGPRMTKEDFIKNNRGINDNADLPEDYLKGIYDEITHNEIVLNTEREHAAALGLTDSTPTGRSGLFSRNDLAREVAHQADQEMSSKAEQRLRSLIRAQRKVASKSGAIKYFPATSTKHVGPMFDVSWMSFLSGFSGPMQNTQNIETIKLCMEGIRLAIKVSCLFDLETPRVAFVTILANATNLGNAREMMAKNLEALKVLIDVALTEGNTLRSSWSEILTCISQLDRLQLISGGVDEDAVPDMRKASIVKPAAGPGQGRRPNGPPRRARTGHGAQSSVYQPEIVQETRSTDMIKAVDRIFTSTAKLNGDAIVHFVRALSEVSWQEIQSSGQSESPRMYSLQKLVEISYYNMTRVRFEWTNIWLVLGEHFNEVGCHSNSNIVFFALDSLRQLSMRFMEIEELPGFKFQKDFLKPFEHVMANSSAVAVKDMVLRCLIQMIQARGENIRSGWKTMFGVFTVAAREPYEVIVNLAFEHVNSIYKNRFGVVIAQGAFADLVVCLTEFSKNLKFQRRSLQAIDMLKSTIPRMLRTPECPLSQKPEIPPSNASQDDAVVSRYANRQTQEEQFWFPVLFAFHDVLMTGEDLEVRSQALNFLFDTLIQYGNDFPRNFWETLWRQLLYPIFMVLKSKSEMSKVANHEDLSVWLSTTMIQALRNMMALFTHYFESLEYMLDRFLDLLALCICQENDTIARIGSNCLQTLILENVTKFREEHWHKIVSAFVQLFDRTTAHQLFTATTTTSSTANISEDDDISIDDQESLDDLSLGNETIADVKAKHRKMDSLNGLVVEQVEEDSNGPSVLSPTAQATVETELEDYKPQGGPQQQPVVVTAAKRRLFNRIITRCILQLLMIETVNELFLNNQVYAQIPSPELLRLMAMLKKSYHFAKKFNSDKDLRMRLYREGFMKQPPNLLKQESGSAATYISILVRMYFDEGEERRNNRNQIEAALVPLCADIIRSYVYLDEETQHRNIMAWRPVVVDVMEAYANFPAADFGKHVETFYPLIVELLSRDIGVEIRLSLQSLFRRVGEVKLAIAPLSTPSATPTSPGRGYFERRSSLRGTW